MKYLIILLVFLSACARADTAIGLRCYWIEPPNAPQDNAWEKMWVKEIGEPNSGIFDSEGYHEDLQGIRTPIHSTSRRTYTTDGRAEYTRFTYGVLGPVWQEIYLARIGDVRWLYNMPHAIAIFISRSFLHETDGGFLEGTFTFEVWHHDQRKVQLYSGTNENPGIIRGIDCAELP